ncbi:MAG: hypothetical protein AAGA99_14635 [Actinomycetota bacterium]
MRKLTLTLLAVLFVAASCGGDSDDSSSGGSLEDWCGLANEFDSVGDSFDAIDPTDPDAVRDVFEQADDALGRIRSAAPDAISDDVNTFVDAFGELSSAIADADYNLFDADLSVIEEAGDRVDTASASIEAFNQSECGIEGDSDDESDDDSGDDSDFDPAAGTLREQLVDTFIQQGFTPDEASCIAENADLGAVAGGDTASLLEVFESCGIDLSRLAELGG